MEDKSQQDNCESQALQQRITLEIDQDQVEQSEEEENKHDGQAAGFEEPEDEDGEEEEKQTTEQHNLIIEKYVYDNVGLNVVHEQSDSIENDSWHQESVRAKQGSNDSFFSRSSKYK